MDQLGEVEGAIVDGVALDFDDDARTDLAVAAQEGDRGAVSVYLHRSPGDRWKLMRAEAQM